jgi:hypothetical protein
MAQWHVKGRGRDNDKFVHCPVGIHDEQPLFSKGKHGLKQGPICDIVTEFELLPKAFKKSIGKESISREKLFS